MATGRVLQFDHGRGYGFIAADDGQDDVFLHASVFEGDTGGLHPGVSVEFQVVAGDRGRKAFAVHLSSAVVAVASATALAPAAAPVADDEQTCDVLSETEFNTEVTELLLKTVPGLTGAQIVEVRRRMLDFAGRQGWVDADQRLW
jgi:cold shock CspA family protein